MSTPPTIKPARAKNLRIEDKRFHVPFIVESSCPTCAERHSVDLTREYLPDGVYGATWVVPTRLGEWLVHEPSDPGTSLISINTRFQNPERAGAVIASHAAGGQLNPHSGKWNHNWSLGLPTDADVAKTLMVDFEHAARVIFPEIAVPASHYTAPHRMRDARTGRRAARGARPRPRSGSTIPTVGPSPAARCATRTAARRTSSTSTSSARPGPSCPSTEQP